MKRKMFIFGIVSFLGITAATVFATSEKSEVSDLLTANIEALANGESDKICSFEIVIKDSDKHTLKCEGYGEQCCKFD